MDRLAEETRADLLQGLLPGQSEPFATLESYLTEIADACYHLSNYAWSNLALRQELLPWIESLKWRQEMGQYALRLLRALETSAPSVDGPGSDKVVRLVQRLKEAIAEVQNRPQRIGGKALHPLARYALEQATTRTAAATAEEVS